MIVHVDRDYVYHYITGVLDHALSTYAKHNTLEKWDEFLNTQPVCNFLNTTDWSIDPETREIVYKIDGPKEGQDRLEATMIIINDNDELLYHSINSSSYFFRAEDNNRLTALYVD